MPQGNLVDIFSDMWKNLFALMNLKQEAEYRKLQQEQLKKQWQSMQEQQRARDLAMLMDLYQTAGPEAIEQVPWAKEAARKYGLTNLPQFWTPQMAASQQAYNQRLAEYFLKQNYVDMRTGKPLDLNTAQKLAGIILSGGEIPPGIVAIPLSTVGEYIKNIYERAGLTPKDISNAEMRWAELLTKTRLIQEGGKSRPLKLKEITKLSKALAQGKEIEDIEKEIGGTIQFEFTGNPLREFLNNLGSGGLPEQLDITLSEEYKRVTEMINKAPQKSAEDIISLINKNADKLKKQNLDVDLMINIVKQIKGTQ